MKMSTFKIWLIFNLKEMKSRITRIMMFPDPNDKYFLQAGAELGQSQIKLEKIIDIVVKG